MKILGIIIALFVLFTLVACDNEEPLEPLVTGECTNATTTSLTAHATVNSLEDGSLSRRGFVYMEGTDGDTALNITIIPLVNPSFEDGDPPTGWSVYLVSRARVSDPVKAGNYSVEIISEEDEAGNLYQRNPIPETEVEGETLIFGAWVYATAGDRVCVAIRDVVEGNHAMTSSACHPGDGSWHWLTVTRTLRTNLDYWNVEIRIKSGSEISVYADGAALVENAVFEDVEFGTGEYSLVITGLKPDTSYRVRAFVENEAGIGYGDVVSCKTLE